MIDQIENDSINVSAEFPQNLAEVAVPIAAYPRRCAASRCPLAVRLLILCVSFAILAACRSVGPEAAVGDDNTNSSDSFDALAAWEEFEDEFRAKYAYLDRPDFDVEALFARARTLGSATDNPATFRAVVYQTLRAFADPHLIVGPLDSTDYAIVPSASDLAIGYDDDRFVVLDVRGDSDADSAGVRPGWILLTVNARPVAEVAREPFGEVVADPSPRQLAFGATVALAGFRGDPGPRELVFDAGGQQHTVRLPPTSRFGRSLGSLPPLSIRRVHEDSRTVGIVRFHNSLGDNATIAAFDEAIRALADTEAIILDLRNTPGGGNTDVARAVIGHFVTEPQAYQVHEIPAVARATSVPRRFVEYALPRSPHYPGPVAVLGGRWTGSMGEGLVIGLDAAAGALTVGSDMGKLLGALWNVDLPVSGLRLDLGIEALFHVDGTPRAEYRMDMHLPAADRDEAGGDPALETALKALLGR
ncbi:MAG: hypothetical protein JJU27_01465 [Gammaproteobacteria bacterium]|nr:hypothetical protein [Gammaproteobacteria bacterium]